MAVRLGHRHASGRIRTGSNRVPFRPFQHPTHSPGCTRPRLRKILWPPYKLLSNATTEKVKNRVVISYKYNMINNFPHSCVRSKGVMSMRNLIIDLVIQIVIELVKMFVIGQ